MQRQREEGALVQRRVERAAAMVRLLGHPARLRLVAALARGERCVSELQQTLGLPQAIISQHLAKLRLGGLVRCRRDGPHVRYAVADQRALRVLDCLDCGSATGSNDTPNRMRQ